LTLLHLNNNIQSVFSKDHNTSVFMEVLLFFWPVSLSRITPRAIAV